MVISKKNTCPTCSKLVRGSDLALQCEGTCQAWYHITCEGVTDDDYNTMLEDDSTSWICGTCFAMRSQFLKDGAIPAGSKATPPAKGKKGKGGNQEGYQPAPKGKPPAFTVPKQIKVDDLNPSVKMIGTSLNQLIGMCAELQRSVSFFSTQYDEFNKNFAALEKGNKEILTKMTTLKEENKILTQENKLLKSKMSFLEQRMISNELEINGVPQSENENCQNIFETICEKIKCQIAKTDVIEVRRISPREANNKARKIAAPSIVVTLSNHVTCQRVLEARKADLLKQNRDTPAEPVSLKDIGFSKEGNFYINERLTAEYRRLFWLARQTKKIGYKYCWVKNGNIYIRKAENTPFIRITQEEDIPVSGAHAKNTLLGANQSLDDQYEDASEN